MRCFSDPSWEDACGRPVPVGTLAPASIFLNNIFDSVAPWGIASPGRSPSPCFALFWAVYPHLLVSYRTGTEQHPCCQPLARHPCLAFRTSLRKFRRPQRRSSTSDIASQAIQHWGPLRCMDSRLRGKDGENNVRVKALSVVTSSTVFQVFTAPVASHDFQKRTDHRDRTTR